MNMTTVSKFLGHWGAVCGMMMAGLWLAGCQSGPQFADVPGLPNQAAAAPAVAGAQPAAPAEPAGIDMLRPGDIVVISFSDLPYLQPPLERRIAEDGTINLIENETFTAAKKTPGQLEKEIRERYVPKKFVKMTVSVIVKADTQFYYVGGEVKNSGRQVYISRIKVLGAIKSAGDFTDYANKKKVQLTRTDGRTFKINCKDALKDPTLDLEVFPGDNIHVPRRNPFSF